MKQKKGMKFKDAVMVAFSMARANLVRLLVTILLLAMCCSAIGLCFTTIIPDYYSRQIKIFSANPSRYVGFSNYNWSSSTPNDGERPSLFFAFSPLGSSNSTTLGTLSDEEVLHVEEETELSYAYIYYDTALTWIYHEEWFYGDFDRYEEARTHNEALDAGEKEHTDDYSINYRDAHPADEAKQIHYISGDGQSVRPAWAVLPDTQSLGVSMLAGRLPEAVDEIAISECQLYEFMRRGYCLYEDVAAEQLIEPQYNQAGGFGHFNPSLPDNYILNLDEIPKRDPAKVVSVTSAEDILGKKVLFLEEVTKDGKETNLYTITGVVDTGCGYDYYEHTHRAAFDLRDEYALLQDKIFVSDAAVRQMGLRPSCMIALRPTERTGIVRCLKVLQETLDAAHEKFDKETKLLEHAIMIAEERELADQLDNQITLFPQIHVLFGVAGAVFGIFGVLLTYYLMSAAAEKERKAIGILKTLGGRDRDVIFLFFLLALGIGIAVYLLSVAGTLGLVSFMGGMSVGGVPVLEFGVLQAAMLFVFCVGLPILTMEIPIRKFLKQTCIAMIREQDAKKEE